MGYQAGFLTSIILCCLRLAQGSTTVELRLVEYTVNGDHYDGSQCDPILPPLGNCDPEFIFCFDHYNGTDDMNQCFRKIQTKQYDNTNTVMFADSVQGREDQFDDPFNFYEIRNPFNIPIWDPYSGFKMKVAVHDNDLDGDDLIDLIYFTYNPVPARTQSVAMWESQQEYGSRTSNPSYLRFDIQVYCNFNYFTNSCAVDCYPQDNKYGGHYTCDTDTGQKLCLDGWETPALDCQIKENNCEVNNCQNGGTCLDGYNTYTCFCPLGYIGPFCQYHKCQVNADYCKNGGSCVLSNSSEMECLCTEGFNGVTCSVDLSKSSEHSDKGVLKTWAIVVIVVVVVIVVLIFILITVIVIRSRSKHSETNTNVNSTALEINNPTFIEDNADNNNLSPPAYSATNEAGPVHKPPIE